MAKKKYNSKVKDFLATLGEELLYALTNKKREFISPIAEPSVDNTPAPVDQPQPVNQPTVQAQKPYQSSLSDLQRQNIPLIEKHFPEDPRLATAIFQQESQLGKFEQNLQGAPAYGISQVYLPSHRQAVPGETDEAKIEWLKNPDNNLSFARKLYDERGWQPWDAYRFKQYEKYMDTYDNYLNSKDQDANSR
jgi:hypothetical protein